MSDNKVRHLFTRRNKIPMKLIEWASLLLDKQGQEVLAEAFTRGGVEMVNEWKTQSAPTLDDLFKDAR